MQTRTLSRRASESPEIVLRSIAEACFTAITPLFAAAALEPGWIACLRKSALEAGKLVHAIARPYLRKPSNHAWWRLLYLRVMARGRLLICEINCEGLLRHTTI
jgi:hypothetical protein